MASFDNEVATWVRSLELSIDIRNPKRDLANGCVVAEILARYFPDLVPLHSFENVSSLPLKDANWHLLLKLFRRIGLAVDEAMANRVMLCEEGAAVELMQRIWRHLAGTDTTVAAASDTAAAAQIVGATAPEQAGSCQPGTWQAGAACPTVNSQRMWPGAVSLQPQAHPQQTYVGASTVPGWQQPVGAFPAQADASFWQTQQQTQPTASQTQELSQGLQLGYSSDAAATQQQDESGAQQWQQAMQLAELQQWQAMQQSQQWAAPPGVEPLPQDPGWQQAQQPPAQQQAAIHKRRTGASRRASGAAKAAGRQKKTAEVGRQAPHAAAPLQAQAQQHMSEQSWSQQSVPQQPYAQQSIPQLDPSQQAQSQQANLQAVLWQQQAMQQHWLQQQQLMQQQQLQDQKLQEQQMALQQQHELQQQLYQEQMQQLQQQQLHPGQGVWFGSQQPEPQQQIQHNGMSGSAGMMQQIEMQAAATQPSAPPIPAVHGQMMPHDYAHLQSAQMSEGDDIARAGFWDAAGSTAQYKAGASPLIYPADDQQALQAQQHTGQHHSASDADTADETSNSRIPTLAVDRKPRPVDFRPFTQEEFRQKNFDAKHVPKYWELGLLGPVPDEQLETKLQARQRVRDFGCRTAKQNHERLAAIAAQQANKKPAERPLTARERAMSFAKCIQRPASTMRLTQSAQGRLTNAIGGAADAAAAAGDAAASSSSRLSRAQVQRENELARLQRQHEADQRSVAAIAQDLRMHGIAQPAGQ